MSLSNTFSAGTSSSDIINVSQSYNLRAPPFNISDTIDRKVTQVLPKVTDVKSTKLHQFDIDSSQGFLHMADAVLVAKIRLVNGKDKDPIMGQNMFGEYPGVAAINGGADIPERNRIDATRQVGTHNPDSDDTVDNFNVFTKNSAVTFATNRATGKVALPNNISNLFETTQLRINNDLIERNDHSDASTTIRSYLASSREYERASGSIMGRQLDRKMLMPRAGDADLRAFYESTAFQNVDSPDVSNPPFYERQRLFRNDQTVEYRVPIADLFAFFRSWRMVTKETSFRILLNQAEPKKFLMREGRMATLVPNVGATVNRLFTENADHNDDAGIRRARMDMGVVYATDGIRYCPSEDGSSYSKQNSADDNYEIVELYLEVPYLFPSPSVDIVLQGMIDEPSVTPFVYTPVQIVDSGIYYYNVNKINDSTNFTGTKPVFVAVMIIPMVNVEVFHRSENIFHHGSVVKSRLLIENTRINAEDYESDFSNVHNQTATSLYEQYLRSVSSYLSSDQGALINYEEFKSTYPIFCYPIPNNTEDYILRNYNLRFQADLNVSSLSDEIRRGKYKLRYYVEYQISGDHEYRTIGSGWQGRHHVFQHIGYLWRCYLKNK